MEEDGSGILLDSQSCSDSSIEGKKVVSAVVLVVSVLMVVLDKDGNVFALLFTRVRRLLRDMICYKK
jgi:hypothetical protein